MRTLLLAVLLLAIGHAAGAQIPTYVPTAGLALYFPFNGNATDASPNGNNGIVYGCTPVAGKSGSANTAYQFNGTSNYIKVPHSASISPSKITVYAKIMPLAFYNGACKVNELMSKGYLVPGGYLLRFQPSNNTSGSCSFTDSTNENYNAAVGTTGTSNAIFNNPPFVRTNTWDDVIMTYDSGLVKMYVNGVKRFQVTNTAGIGTNTNDLYIGKNNDPGYEYWYNGIIDDIGIWNRSLTTCEINRIHYGLNSFVAIQPANQSTYLGNTATFTLSSGLPPGATQFRWQSHNGSTYYYLSNGGQYSGVTTNTLAVSGVTPANANQLFRCIVSDTSGCPDTSASATLTIPNLSVGQQQVSGSYLSQNMPNPSTGISTINYYIAGAVHHAEIAVYDMVGRKVVSKAVALSGNGSWGVDNLPAGSYSYSLILDGVRFDTKRMQVLGLSR